jgi:hypothetical protein
MLAYVFWHRPGPDVDSNRYEEAQRTFHAALNFESACFRLDALPFDPGPGYEDWYLTENWHALGLLTEAAVDPARRPAHDHAAAEMAVGWGGLYSLARGPAVIPDGAEWYEKPRLVPTETFLADLPETTIWRRQLVLGPAPEICVAVPGTESRRRIWPAA